MIEHICPYLRFLLWQAIHAKKLKPVPHSNKTGLHKLIAILNSKSYKPTKLGHLSYSFACAQRVGLQYTYLNGDKWCRVGELMNTVTKLGTFCIIHFHSTLFSQQCPHFYIHTTGSQIDGTPILWKQTRPIPTPMRSSMSHTKQKLKANTKVGRQVIVKTTVMVILFFLERRFTSRLATDLHIYVLHE